MKLYIYKSQISLEIKLVFKYQEKVVLDRVMETLILDYMKNLRAFKKKYDVLKQGSVCLNYLKKWLGHKMTSVSGEK